MIHVIGAGWYGCAIAHRLLTRGFQVIIWEKEKEIFQGASFYNQNRLHLGYHYPRCSITRQESRDGFEKFKQEYPYLSKTVANNVYAVANNSIIDYETYVSIFKSEGYKFVIDDPRHYGLNDVKGAIVVNEEVIDHNAAKEFWSKLGMPLNLDEHLIIEAGAIYSKKTGRRISDSDDLIVDCTWGECQPNNDNYFEEWFLSIVLKKKGDLGWGALTLMDGPFFSIYPLCCTNDSNLFTLTHVALCPINGKNIASDQIHRTCDSVLSDVSSYCPNIFDKFEFVDTFISRKLKPKSRADRRSVGYRVQGNVLNVYAGKIDAVFFAVDIAEKWVGSRLGGQKTGMCSGGKMTPSQVSMP